MTDSKKIINNTVYPNSPLIEVVCEIGFPGDMSVDCHRDLFHNQIIKEYPHILVPKVTPDTALALEPYRFENVDNNSGIMLSMNKFAYYSKAYKGHKIFIKEFIRLIDILKGVYPKIDKLSRFGWRYIF